MLTATRIAGRVTGALSLSCLLALPTLLFAQPADNPAPGAVAPAARPARAPRKAAAPRPRGTAYVRVLHAIPNAPAVDVFVDGGKKAEGLTFKSISDYLALPSGSRTFVIKKAGSDETLASIKKSTRPDIYYVLAAAPVEGKPGFVWQNETTGKVREGRASVRVYHLAGGAPPVAVTLPAARGTGTRTAVKELTFGKSRAVALTGGTASLQLRAADKLIKEAPATVEVGKKYAAFAVGDKDNVEIILKPVGK